MVPLISPVSYFGYEQIKVLFFIALVSLIAVLWISKGIKLTGIGQAAGLFILTLLVSSLAGLDPKSSLLGTEPYFQGWVVYVYLLFFALMVGRARMKLEYWAVALVSSAGVVSFLAIKDWVLVNIFSHQIPTYAGRVVSTFGQPNFYAGFLLLVLPFSYLLSKNPVKKLQLLGWGSGFISIIAILVSYSRSTILLTLLLILLALISRFRMKLKIGFIVCGIIAVSVLLALKLSSGLVGSEVSGAIKISNPDLTRESVEKRAYIWPLAWKIGWQRPIIGYGLETIGKAFSDYFEENKHPLFEENLQVSPVLISMKDLNIDRSHNYILDLLLFSGGLGLLGWLGLVGVLFWKLGQNTKHPTIVGKNVLIVSLVTYLVWIQFQNQSIVHLIYFWLIVGMIDKES